MQYLTFIMKVHSQKSLFRISALALILIALFLTIALVWKWMDIPKTPDPAIWNGFPKEEVWRKFFSFSIPLIYGLFTLLYTILSKLISTEKSKYLDELHRYQKYDFLTYGLIPIFLLMIILWRYLGDWYMWFGGFYLSIVFIKVSILLKAIYRWIVSIQNGNTSSLETDIAKPLPLYIRWGLFLIALLLYASVSLWINYSISTTGDEQHYLLITHSLLHDRDFDLKNNIEQEDYKRFSWVYFPKHNMMEKNGRLYSVTYNSLLCFLLLPGYALGSILPDYALGERLGAILTINLLTAWLLLELFLFTLEISKSYRAAFISWAIAGLTSPVFFFSSQVYPEIGGAVMLLFTLRRLLNPAFRWKGLLVVISAVILISLGIRFMPIAISLILLWLIGLTWRKKLIISVLLIISAIVFIGIDRIIFKEILFIEEVKSRGMWKILSRLIPQERHLQAIGGLFFDQEFGLLFYSPIYAFALIGLPWLLKRYRKETLIILFPVMIYIYILISIQLYSWYGGWSLPSRYLVVITFLIAFMSAIMVDAVRNRFASILISASYVWGIGITFILTLVPIWRYNSVDGTNVLLSEAERFFNTKITRLFPSFISPTPEGLTVLLSILILFITAGVFLRNSSVKSESVTTKSSSLIPAILLLISLGIIIILLGRILPTRQLEAEGMEHTAGIHYRDKKINVWVLMETGSIWDNVIFPNRGPVSINILAAGQCNTGEAPHMVVRVGERVIGERDLLYGKDSWHSSYYTFEVSPMDGIQPFSIELTNGTYDTKNGTFCGFYVDRIEFK